MVILSKINARHFFAVSLIAFVAFPQSGFAQSAAFDPYSASEAQGHFLWPPLTYPAPPSASIAPTVTPSPLPLPRPVERLQTTSQAGSSFPSSSRASRVAPVNVPVMKVSSVASNDTYDWTGTYFGIQMGGGDGASRRNFSQGDRTTKAFNVSGPAGGITLGHNEQFGSFVVGVEGDFSLNGSTGQAHRPNPTYTYATDNPWFATFRPRAGYAFGNVLPYVTGGLAIGNVRTSAYNTVTGDVGTDYDRMALGWTAGTGVEVALSPAWSIKAEYLYLGLGDTTGPSDTGSPTTTSFNEHIGRVGLNYKFGEGSSLYNAWQKEPEQSSDEISLGTLTGIELGGEASNFRYQEHIVADSVFDKDNGTKLGVTLAATKALSTGFFGTIDARVAESHDEYSGSSGEHLSNVPDYVGEISVTGGKDFIFDRVDISPYTGLGYYTLFKDYRNGSHPDGFNDGPRSDEQYFYLPLGATTRFRITNGSRLSLNAEYDQLIEGWKKAYESDINPSSPNVAVVQYGGYGLRGSAMVEWASWSVGPFFEYWNIDQSANVRLSDGFNDYEPHNQTIEYGLQARYRF